MGSSPTSRTILFSAPAAIGSRVGFKNRMFWVRIPGGAPFIARVLEFWHTGWSQKPVSHGRESSNLSMRTNIFAPLPQLVVGLVSETRCCGFESHEAYQVHVPLLQSVVRLDLKSECCGFESHEAYQYFVSFLCVAQSGRVLGLDPRGRRFKSCRTDHVL